MKQFTSAERERAKRARVDESTMWCRDLGWHPHHMVCDDDRLRMAKHLGWRDPADDPESYYYQVNRSNHE